ncbi:hypothetical protein [Nocardiopsis coralliicola]
MRTYFDPDDGEYEAGRAALVRALAAWAADLGDSADPYLAGALLDYRQHRTPDGRLALWTPGHVRELLLDWAPFAVALPGDSADHDLAPTLDLYLRFLDAQQLADPRASVEPARGTAREVRAEHRAAMAEPRRWGPAKFWATAAAESGADPVDAEAVRAFVQQVRSGGAGYPPDIVEAVRSNAASGGPGRPRAEPSPPVVLPGSGALYKAAAESPVAAQLAGIADWAGADGRKLTAAGYVRPAQARALARSLGTDPEAAATARTAADLPELGRMLAWAERARLVRRVRGRLVAVARARPLLADHRALWDRALEALVDSGGVLTAEGGRRPAAPSPMRAVFGEVLLDALGALYAAPVPVPWPRLRETVREGYGGDPLSLLPPEEADAELDRADRDLAAAIGALVRLGAVRREYGRADRLYIDMDGDGAADEDDGAADELRRLLDAAGPIGGEGEGESGIADGAADDSGDGTGGEGAAGQGGEPGRPLAPEATGQSFEAVEALDDHEEAERRRARSERLRAELEAGPVELLSLTALGTAALQERFTAEGRDAPVVGDLRGAGPVGMLGVLTEHYTPETARMELDGWMDANGGPGSAMEALLAGLRGLPYRSRIMALMSALADSAGGDEDPRAGVRLVRSLRSDPLLAPTALQLLLNVGELERLDLTEDENLRVGAEGLLQMMEVGDPGEVRALIRVEIGGDEFARAAVSDVLTSAHPDAAGMERLRHLIEGMEN